MKAIAPGLFTFTGLAMGRVYAIEDPDGLTLVDAGLDLAAERILAQLRAASRSPGQVRRLLVTHAHPDHVGGLRRLQQATGAAVITSKAERPVVAGTEPVARPDPARLSGLGRLMQPRQPVRFPPTPVAQTVGDGDVLPEVMGGLHVLLTPGHSPGHLSFWQPERRILLCGDVILNIPFGLRLPFAAFTVDMDEDRRSITRLAALEPDLICFGHGPPLHRGAPLALHAFARRVATD
jgi:glyoxylase-like metal-dependent hydrolase (beta-lactamase superfamily II)